MINKKGLFFSKHRPYCSKELVSHSKDCFPVDKPFGPSFVIVLPEVLIMHNHTYAHKPYYSSQMPVPSFTDFTFSFKTTRFIDSRVNSAISDELLWGVKPFNITHFSQKMHSGNISNSLYRFQDLDILTKRGLFTELSKHISEEFKLFFKEEELFDFLDKDQFSYRPVLSNGFFSKGFNLLGRDIKGSSWGFSVKGFIDLFNRGILDSMSRRKFREESEDRGIVDVNNSFELREKYNEVFFDIIFNSSDLLGNSFSFPCNITKIFWKEGFIRELFMDMIQHYGDSFSISSVSFSFSESSSEEFIDKQRIKNNAGEVFLSKISKKIDVVTTRGFLSNKDRVLRERGKPFREVFKTRMRHGEFCFKDDIIWRAQSTGRERVFGDIDTYKNLKVFVNHGKTSLIVYKAEAGACQPILHGDKGLVAQPTYHGLSRQATNSFEGLLAQEVWSCPALPYAMYMGKTHSYKSYTTNFS